MPVASQKADPVPVLLICAFFFSIAIGSVNYAIIFYLKDLFHVDKGIIGVAASVQSLVYLATMLVFLKWRTPSARNVILAALFWAPICIATYLVVPFLGVTLAFHGLFGIATALFWPRVGGWVSRGKEGADLSRNMGRFNLSWSAGGIIAPLAGGILLTADVRLPFLVTTGLLILLFVLALLTLGHEPVVSREASGSDTLAAVKTPLRLPARLGMVSLCFFVGTLMNIYPAYARDAFHVNEALIGTFLMARMAFNAAGFLVWSRLTFWHFQPWVVPTVQVLTLVLVLLFPFADQPLQVFGLYALVGVLFSFQYSYCQFHSNAGYVDRTRGNTIHEMVINAGYIFGTAVCGWVSEVVSMSGAFWLAAAVALVLGVIQLILLGPRLAKGKAFCLAEAGQQG